MQDLAQFDPNSVSNPDNNIYGLPFTEEDARLILLPVQQALRDRDSELYKVQFGNPSLLSQQRVLGLMQFAYSSRADRAATQVEDAPDC